MIDEECEPQTWVIAGAKLTRLDVVLAYLQLTDFKAEVSCSDKYVVFAEFSEHFSPFLRGGRQLNPHRGRSRVVNNHTDCEVIFVRAEAQATHDVHW